jgi:hypothetical protein
VDYHEYEQQRQEGTYTIVRFVYYSSNDAWDGFGVVVYADDGRSLKPRLRAAAKVNMDYDKDFTA